MARAMLAAQIALKSCTVSGNRNIEFFEQRFDRQLNQLEVWLNPVEQSALRCLHGQVLDYGCGMGQLVIGAARACSVLALETEASLLRRLERRHCSHVHMHMTLQCPDSSREPTRLQHVKPRVAVRAA